MVPQLHGALRGWCSWYTGFKVVQSSVDYGVIKKTKEPLRIFGNLQPTPNRLMQDTNRGWANAEWTLLIPEKDRSLKFDDIINLRNKFYQVRVIDNWQESNFVRYGLTESIEDISLIEGL